MSGQAGDAGDPGREERAAGRLAGAIGRGGSPPGLLVAVTTGWIAGSAEHPGRRVAIDQTYLEGVRVADCLPLVLGPGLGGSEVRELVGRSAGLLLTGGDDIDPGLYGQAPAGAKKVSPERDAMEVEALEAALEGGLPVLAICRGIQLLNVHLGGDLWQDLPSQRPGEVEHDVAGEGASRPVHSVTLAEGSILTRALGTTSLRTNSTHHQGVRRMGRGLVETARAEDGLVEAVELRRGADSAPVVGVQWHPERLLAEASGSARRLFAWFGEAVTRAAAQSPGEGRAAGAGGG
jgi:putative glutamine amidotransferase